MRECRNCNGNIESKEANALYCDGCKKINTEICTVKQNIQRQKRVVENLEWMLVKRRENTNKAKISQK